MGNTLGRGIGWLFKHALKHPEVTEMVARAVVAKIQRPDPDASHEKLPTPDPLGGAGRSRAPQH